MNEQFLVLIFLISSIIRIGHVLTANSCDDAVGDRTCGFIMMAISLQVAVSRSLNTPTRARSLANKPRIWLQVMASQDASHIICAPLRPDQASHDVSASLRF
jgi:hypothetical protein